MPASKPFTNANGEPIPPDAFENDLEARPLPLTDQQRQEFDAETEALRQHKRK